jgi:integral membrane sensor domain MASE1
MVLFKSTQNDVVQLMQVKLIILPALWAAVHFIIARASIFTALHATIPRQQDN